jgi:signal transduction histidine kinase
MLDDLGLLATMLWHAERFSAQTGVQVDVQHGELTLPVPPEIAMTAYRVSQEALTNVARHANVNRATVQLWTASHILYVQVTDAGAGFDVDAVLSQPVSSGLFGMRERVRLVGGTLSIESVRGAGTQVMAELPLGHIDEARGR